LRNTVADYQKFIAMASFVVSHSGLSVYIVEMLRKPSITVASACLAFIVYATLCPIHDRPHFWGLHEPHGLAALERLTAFLALGFAARFAIPRWRSVLLVFATAIGLEVLQNLVPHRDPRLIDAAVKIVGGTIGIILAEYLTGWWEHRHLAHPSARSIDADDGMKRPSSVTTRVNDGFEMTSLVPEETEDLGAGIADTEPS
jgi:hypothetical protein